MISLKGYEKPKASLLEFEKDVFTENTNSSQTCNCQAEQASDNASLQDGCEVTSYGFIEVGDHY